MGTLAEVIAPSAGGTRKTVSEGGIRYEMWYGEFTFPATYATNGDTVPKPQGPAGGTLKAVQVVHAALPAGIDVQWDGGTSTIKLKAFDEDNTSGVAAELANGNGQLDGITAILGFLYRIGG